MFPAGEEREEKPMSVRGRPRQFDRQDALNDATQLFWQKGFNSTSVEDLLKEMGINRGSMYATYGDKKSLFVEAIQHYTSQAMDGLAQFLHTEGSVRDSLRKTLAYVARLDKSKDCKGCLLTHTAIEIAEADSDIGTLVRSAMSNIVDEFQRALERGMANGEFANIKDPEHTAALLVTTCHGLNVLCKAGYPDDYIERVIDSTLELAV